MQAITFAHRHSPRTGRGSIYLRRSFWAGLLILHALALPSLFSTLASASVAEQLPLIPRIAGLLLSAIYFTLKFVDVPWLRARQNWRTAVAAIMIVGLLHVGVLDRAFARDAGFEFELQPWLFLSAVLSTALLIRRLLAELAIRFPSRAEFPNLAPQFARQVSTCWRPHELVAHVRYAAPRGPPLI